MSSPTPAARPDLRDESPHWLLYVLVAAAVLLGLWGRFKGLGSAPLSADEYYIARSVEDILRTGLPEYDCGGYYTRGLLFQYLLALLQLAGMTPEFSARFVAAVSSVLVLPAVYLLGRRMHSPTAGLLAVVVLALSAWEVDIARFGRMYAPFQAVFAWYLVYFVRHAVDGDRRALPKMLLLSAVGVFTWEGGVMLAVTNLLPPLIRSPEGRFTARDVRYLVLCGLFVIAAYFATFTNFRHLGTDPFPPGFDAGAFFESLEEANPRGAPLNLQAAHDAQPALLTPLGLGIGAVLLALAFWSCRWIWALRRRWPAALGLTVALIGALAHQFALVAFVICILLLGRALALRDFASRDAVPYVATLTAAAAGWTVIALASPVWLASLDVPWGEASTPVRLAYEFLRFPDFLGIVALPLVRAAAVLGAVLFAALAMATLQCIARGEDAVTTERVLLLAVVCLLAVASMGDPPRFETRYVVFLYPVVVLVAVTLAVRATRRLGTASTVTAAALAAIVFTVFASTGDFQPRRLLHFDGASTYTGRANLEKKTNILRRSDPRGAAEWLARNATAPGTITINGYPSVDFYFRQFDFAFIGLDNHRYWTYSCQRGTVERWGNLPLLSDAVALDREIARSGRAFIVIDTPSRSDLIATLAAWLPQVAWTSDDGYISILAIDVASSGPISD